MIRNPQAIHRAFACLLFTMVLGPTAALCQVDSDQKIDPWAYRLRYKTVPMGDRVEAKYREMYGEVLAALESSEWRVALKRANRLVHDLRDSVSDSSRSLAARVLVLRAIANAALGNERDALWDYDVAVAFLPEVAQASLPDYSGATSKLQQRLQEREPCTHTDRVTPIGNPDDIVPPKPWPETREAPKYPRGMRNLSLRGAVVITSCIDRRGFVTRPEVLVSMPMPFMLSAFEALGAWRFWPGTADGEPFVTKYTATLNFKLGP